MPSVTIPGTDVLQSHDHAKLTAEEIAKAVARHNKTHKDKGTPPAGKKAGPGGKPPRKG